MKAHHFGIYVNDLRQSERFYEHYFGYKVIHRFNWNQEELSYLSRDNDDMCLELIQAKDVKPKQGTIHVAWEVEEFEKEMNRLEALGLHPIEGPYDIKPYWKIVFFQGLNWEIIELVWSACHHSKFVDYS